jgi:hypothetical protein
MVRRSTVARMIVLLVALPACDRFAHPKYDPPQYAPASPGGVGGGAGGSGSVSSDVAATGDDITAPGCATIPNGAGAGEGAVCRIASDCALLCCSCDNGGTWSAASCVGGHCASQSTVCARTSSCGTGAVVVGVGSSPDACGGASYADPTCDACMRASCCLEEAHCANDAACGNVESCIGGCTDSQCQAGCEAAYASSNAAVNLDACFNASCAGSCP